MFTKNEYRYRGYVCYCLWFLWFLKVVTLAMATYLVEDLLGRNTTQFQPCNNFYRVCKTTNILPLNKSDGYRPPLSDVDSFPTGSCMYTYYTQISKPHIIKFLTAVTIITNSSWCMLLRVEWLIWEVYFLQTLLKTWHFITATKCKTNTRLAIHYPPPINIDIKQLLARSPPTLPAFVPLKL